MHLSAHACYVQHLPDVPGPLCWLYWRPALSLGEGLMGRMVARSWLLLPVLPKAQEPLRNRKWHMTELGFVPSASSAGWVPACPILLRNSTSGCCWTSCIHTSQQPSHSTAGWWSGNVWRAAVEKGQPCRRKTCSSLWAFRGDWPCRRCVFLACWCLVCQFLLFSLTTAGLWLNPLVALPHFESWCR